MVLKDSLQHAKTLELIETLKRKSMQTGIKGTYATKDTLIVEDNKEAIQDTVSLIIQLAKNDFPKKELTEILMQNKERKSLLDALLDNPEHYASELYQMLELGLIPKANIPKTKVFTLIIVRGIKAIPDDQKKINALILALMSPSNPLYHAVRQSPRSLIQRLFGLFPVIDELRNELEKVCAASKREKEQRMRNLSLPHPPFEKSYALMQQYMPGSTSSSTPLENPKPPTITKKKDEQSSVAYEEKVLSPI